MLVILLGILLGNLLGIMLVILLGIMLVILLGIMLMILLVILLGSRSLLSKKPLCWAMSGRIYIFR